MASDPFVAIDFETADREADSACAVGMVRVEGRRIVARERRLIRPPRSHFVFTHIHGITWNDVQDQPVFGDVWSDLQGLLGGASFIAAHNARFDHGVLLACCRRAGLAGPKIPFRCTVLLARRTWRIFPTALPCVCRRLGIRLNHHDPLSDAEACARIVLAARSFVRQRVLDVPQRPAGSVLGV